MRPEQGRDLNNICVLGSINLDTVASVENLPRPGETVVARSLAQFPGGKGANQAVAAARMDAETLMIGAVGADGPGNSMRTFLQDSGVNIARVKTDANHLTGQAFINVSDSGENAIVIVTGANTELRPADIPVEELTDCGVFLAQLESPVETIRTLFSSDKAQHGITILNAAPAEKEGAVLFPLVDILILNEAELATYAGLPGTSKEKDIVIKAARQLISREGQTVIVTLGADGVVAVNDIRSDIIPSRPADVVDTTGAGDCFCGALAAGLAQGLALAEAIRLAVAAASISVERPGAATSIPTRSEVDLILCRN